MVLDLWNSKYFLRQEAERDKQAAQRREDHIAQETVDLQPGDVVVVSEATIIANKRSKRYYVPSDKAYKRAAKQKSIVYFENEEEALKAGYKHK